MIFGVRGLLCVRVISGVRVLLDVTMIFDVSVISGVRVIFCVKGISVVRVTRRCDPLGGHSSSSCGGLRPMPFFALWAKKGLFMSVLAQILVIFGDQ